MQAFHRVILGVALALAVHAGCAAAPAEHVLNIPEQPLQQALNEFARQTGLQVIVRDRDVASGLRSPSLKGTFSVEEGLGRLLAKSGLTFGYLNERTVAVRPAREPAASVSGAQDLLRLARADIGAPAGDVSSAGETADQEPARTQAAIPEILVTGKKTLNMDIERTRDDIQPYMVFDRRAIVDSGAQTIEEFFRKRLTASTSGNSSGQQIGQASLYGSASSVNLRGLGANQTLILIDGHRTSGATINGDPRQPDLNGIPLAAIERIEVLPTTASGIYGGSATGGVVNVILRRDYTGMETGLTYGDSFDGGGAYKQVDMSAGFQLEGGKTSVLLAGSYRDTDTLFVGDRESLLQRARARMVDNDPTFFTAGFSAPLGRTTNIRSNSSNPDGTRQNLTIKPIYGGGALNSTITHLPEGYPGIATGGSAGLIANAGRFNFGLADTAQQNGGARSSLAGGPTVKSLNATVRRELAPGVQAFVEFSDSKNDIRAPFSIATGNYNISSTAPNNPFVQNIRVTTPTVGADRSYAATSGMRRAVGGVIVRLPRQWQAEADHSWSRARASVSIPARLTGAASTAVGNGTLNVLRDTAAFPVDFSPFTDQPLFISPSVSTVHDTTVRFAGPVGALPAGSVVLSTLLEHRKESFGSGYSLTSFDRSFSPDQSQSIDSLYVEAQVPLIASANGVAAVHRLDLQIAGRRDEYTLHGANTVQVDAQLNPLMEIQRSTVRFSSTNPTIGLRYQPVPDLMLRGSYAEGFLPAAVTQITPSLPALYDAATLAQLLLTDPLRGNEPLGQELGEVLVRGGGSTALQPERSESWSAGIVLSPRILPNLRVSVDWTKTEKIDNIAALILNQSTIGQESAVPGLIVRAAPAGGPFTVGPIAEVNLAYLNVAYAEFESYDFAVDYTLDLKRHGGFDFALAATHLAHIRTQTTPLSPIVENVGVAGAEINLGNVGGGLKWRANGSLVWNYGDWRVGWAAQYFGPYWLNLTHSVVPLQGSATIPSQIYHDAFVSWSAPQALRWKDISRLELQLGMQNIFNTKPPVDVIGASGSNVVGYSSWGDPRLANYSLSVRAAF